MSIRYLVEAKNRMFQKLVAVDRRCRQYRHSHNEDSPELLARVAALQQEYETSIRLLDTPIVL